MREQPDVAIVKDSLRMLRERPLLGWGLGTFPIVYPSFRSFYTNLSVNQAQNDTFRRWSKWYRGLFLAVTCIVLMCRKGIHNLKSWRTDMG